MIATENRRDGEASRKNPVLKPYARLAQWR